MKKFLIALALMLVVGMALSTSIMALAASGTEEKPEEKPIVTPHDTAGTTGTNPEPSTDGSENPYGTEKQKDGKICGDTHEADKPVTYPATCTTNEVTITKCKNCGLELKREETKDSALGHLWDYTNAVVKTGATCSDKGTETVTCLRCGATKDLTTSDGGHKWTEWTAVTKETCTIDGLYKRYCTVCNLVDTKKVAATGKHLFNLKDPQTRVQKRADCDNWGTYEAKCTLCGEWFCYKDLGDNDAIAKLDGTIALKIAKRGHKWGEPVVLKAVNCHEDGKLKKVCLNNVQTMEYEACHDFQEIVVDHNATAYDNRVGHVINKYHNLKFKTEVAATATTNAIGYWYCDDKDCPGEKYNNTKPYQSEQVVKVEHQPTTTGVSNPAATTTTTKPTGSKTSSSSTNKKGVSIPKTNDTTSNLPYVLIAVAFVGLVALVASKKKVNG